MKKNNKGFTLIELLIVIAIIGILAVGLISALDPLEQIKKGSDTTAKTVATNIISAANRFYATMQYYPWCTSATACPVNLSSPTNLTDASIYPAMFTAMASAGELKGGFDESVKSNLGKMFMTYNQTTNVVNMCFIPESKSLRCDPNTHYNQSGGIVAACPSAVLATCRASTTCYYCVQ